MKSVTLQTNKRCLAHVYVMMYDKHQLKVHIKFLV